MNAKTKTILYGFLIFCICFVFLFSCLVTVSDGQGAVVFIMSIPIMVLLFIFSTFLAHSVDQENIYKIRLKKITKIFATIIVLFFVMMPIPILNIVPSGFLTFISKSFQMMTGKTPYAYLKDRNSFPNILSRHLDNSKNNEVNFDSLGVTFAWDQVCILGPYTDSEKAKEILKIDLNLEERSQIHQSDSINALVFLFEGKGNVVVDLKRGIADFDKLDFCLNRNQAQFLITYDANKRRILNLKLD